jgi:hypothetical protein
VHPPSARSADHYVRSSSAILGATDCPFFKGPGGELLRTWTAMTSPNLPDTDAALREAWQAAAFPRR